MSHRGSKMVTVTSLVELVSFGYKSSSSNTILEMKAGSLGSANSMWLSNIRITDIIVGLSSGYCCTHKRPTWRQRSTSDITHDDIFMFEAIKSIPLPAFHNVHDCFVITKVLDKKTTICWISRKHTYVKTIYPSSYMSNKV